MAEPARKRATFEPEPGEGRALPEPKPAPGLDEAALTRLVQRLITEHIETPREEDGGRAGARVMDDHPGDHVGPYRILTRIGRGRLGEVWLAEQRQPPAGRVALEIVRPGVDPQRLARYEDEHRRQAGLEHPNLAGVYETGPGAAGRRYFAMEYVHGEPVLQYADRSLLSIRERIGLMIPVCEGMRRAHALGATNGTLGPRSVLVCDVGGRTLARVLRYAMGGPRQGQASQSSASEPDARGDIRAVGELLYELVIGRSRRSVGGAMRPSQALREPGPQVAEIVRRRHAGLDELVAAVEGRLDEILEKATGPGEGYASAAELADDLGHYLAGRPLSGRGSNEPEAASLVTWRRAKVLVIGSCVVLTLVLAATAIARRAGQHGPKLDAGPPSMQAERQALAGALAKSEAAASAAEAERQRLAEATARSEASSRAAEAERQKLATMTAKSEASLKQAEGERVRLAELSAKAEQALKETQGERARLAGLSAKAEQAAKESEAQRALLLEAQTKADDQARAAEAERQRLAQATAQVEQDSHTDEGLRQRLATAESRAREFAEAAETERRRVADAVAQSQAAAASAEAERQRLSAASARAEQAAADAEAERDRIVQARVRAERAAEKSEAELALLAEATGDAQAQAAAAQAERARLADLAEKARAEAQAAREQRETLERLTAEAEERARVHAEAKARAEEEARQAEAHRQEQARLDAQRQLEEAKKQEQARRDEQAQAARRREQEAPTEAQARPRPAPAEVVIVAPAATAVAPARAAPEPGAAIIEALARDAHAAREHGGVLTEARVDEAASQVLAQVGSTAQGAVALARMGESLGEESMPGLGVRVLRRALEAAKSSLGADHPDSLGIQSRLGSLLLEDSKPSAGEQALREAWEGFKRTRGPEHSDSLRTLGRLGDALVALGRSHDAARLLGAQEAAARSALAGDAPSLGSFLLSLGEARVGQRSLGAGESLLLEASEKLPAGTARARQCARSLGALYERWNAAEPGKGYDLKAAEWKAK